MPYSYVQYTGTGTAPLLSVPFPYLLKAHVRLYTGYDLLTDTWTAELTDGVGFTWTSATQVQLSSNLANGVVLTIIRKTPTNTRLVDWNDASNLLAGDMDTADLQTLYAVQEQQDRVTQAAAIADAANDAVADVLLYAPIANVALIPGSPANGDRIELADSTGIESFSPLSGRPVGFVGSNQLRVRMYWNVATSSWIWVSYYTADPDGRYVRQGSISNSVSSTSQATVASSLAVKTAKDAADAAAAAATAAAAAAATAQSTADATVTTAKLADGAVTAAKLGAGAVTAAKLGSGLILKAQSFFDAGSSTSSTTLANANGLYFNYTPVSSNSKLLLIASFQAQITYLANTTTYGYHSWGESGTAVGLTYVAGANSVAGIGAYAMGTVQASLNNTATTTRSFGIMHRTSNASAAVYSQNIYATILEVAN